MNRKLTTAIITVVFLLESTGLTCLPTKGYASREALRPTAAANVKEDLGGALSGNLAVLKESIRSHITHPIPLTLNLDQYVPELIRRRLQGDKSAIYELFNLMLEMLNDDTLDRITALYTAELIRRGDSEDYIEFYDELLSFFDALTKARVETGVSMALSMIDSLVVLSRQGIQSASNYLEILVDRRKDDYIGAGALSGLASIGRHVAESFSHDSATVRLRALEFLVEEAFTNNASEVLLDILETGDNISKIYAAWGLGILKCEQASDLLEQTYRKTDNISLKRACVWALKNTGFPLKESGIEAPPLYDIDNPGERIDFGKFKPFTAQKESGPSLEDITAKAREKIALYPYLSVVYLVKVEGRCVPGSKREELKDIQNKEIADKISYMVVSKSDAKRFYDEGRTIAVMFQISTGHRRAVVDVDEDGNWYQLKGVGLPDYAMHDVPLLWRKPIFTSNTSSGLAEANPGFVKRLRNDPLAIEREGGDISKFLAACRFETMVTPDGKGFVPASRWKLKSDDELDPKWKPIFIPGTHLVFLGKDPRRTSDIKDLPIPARVRLDWILSELGFLKLGDHQSQQNGFEDYFVWLAKKLGREIANFLNAERSHYFLQHMHNTTLSGKLVDFESLQRLDQVEKIEAAQFLLRDIEHIRIMFENIIMVNLQEIHKQIIEPAETKDEESIYLNTFNLNVLRERVNHILIMTILDSTKRIRGWLNEIAKLTGNGLAVDGAEISSHQRAPDLDPAIGVRLGKVTYLLQGPIHNFVCGKAPGDNSGEGLTRTPRKTIAKDEYPSFLKQIKEIDPLLCQKLERLGEEGRRQITSLVETIRDRALLLSASQLRAKPADKKACGWFAFLNAIYSLEKESEKYAILSIGPRFLAAHKDRYRNFYRYAKNCGIDLQDINTKSCEEFWAGVYDMHKSIFKRHGSGSGDAKAVQYYIETDAVIAKIFSVYRELWQEAEGNKGRFKAEIRRYLRRSKPKRFQWVIEGLRLLRHKQSISLAFEQQA